MTRTSSASRIPLPRTSRTGPPPRSQPETDRGWLPCARGSRWSAPSLIRTWLTVIGHYLAVHPPSTISVVPVTSDAAGDARNTTPPGDVHRLADAVQRRRSARATSASKTGSARSGGGPVRPDERRRDGVDGDAVLAPLDGEAPGQVRDGRLAMRSRSTRSGSATKPGLRAEVDDPPVALADHHPTGGLAGEEQALDVDVHRQVEVGLGDVLGRVRRAETRRC